MDQRDAGTAAEHVLQPLGAGGQAQPVADRLANGFDNPTDFEEWFYEPPLAQGYLAPVTPAAGPAE